MWPYNNSRGRGEPGWFDTNMNARVVQTNILDDSTEETTPVTEPVTLVQAKTQCHIDFPDDDAFITDLITQARQTVENFCFISLVPKTVTLLLDLISAIELPWGPTVAVTSFTDSAGNVISTDMYKIFGKKFQRIEPLGFQWPKATLIYTVGYDGSTLVVEAALQAAILNEVAFRYENRGETADSRKSVNPGICEASQVLAGPYKRNQWV